MRGLSFLATAAALGLVGVGGAFAALQALVLPGDNGDLILTVTDEQLGTKAQLTLICSSRSGDFGMVLAASAPGFPPDTEDLLFRADGAAIGPLHFEKQGPSLLLIGDGGEDRVALGKLARAKAIEIDEGGRTLRFVLDRAASEVARYREQCRL